MRSILVILPILLLYPAEVSAIRITEIMYDTPGTDTGREWIEVHNDTDQSIDLATYRFKEDGVAHEISAIEAGSTSLASGAYAVIVSNREKFQADWPNVPAFRSAFSLKNTGETLELIRDGISESIASYNPDQGGAGDGSSIQFINGAWVAGSPTPARVNVLSQSTVSETIPSSTASSPASTSIVVNGREGQIKNISAKATVKPTALYGMPHEFRGQAFVESSPLVSPKVRYLWTFGDGQMGEGQNITHSYMLPGTYKAVLLVSYGEHTASHYLTIAVESPSVEMVVDRNGQWIEIINKGKFDLDVGSWILRPVSREGTEVKKFFFPPHTIVSQSDTVKIAVQVIGFQLNEGATLYYPNEQKAAEGAIAVAPIKKETVTELKGGTKEKGVNMVREQFETAVVAEIPIQATSSALAAARFVPDEKPESSAQKRTYGMLAGLILVTLSGVFLIAKKALSS